VNGLPRWQLERDEAELLETIRAARAMGPLQRPPRSPRNGHGELPLGEQEKRVFEALRNWRRERALARDVDESRVATTGTLRQIAREPALTRERLAEVPGMSRFRLREYGEEILRIVDESRRGRS
jgi:superfamily II DNA helicase RecQ